MRPHLLIVLIALAPGLLTADPKDPNKERTWKRKLASGKFPMSMSRAEVECLIRAPIVAEFTRDHGFASLRDVYYQLDEEWLAQVAYQPANAKSANEMILTVQPHLVSRTPEFLRYLEEQTSKAKSKP